jgi:phosphatidylglycerol lysyltransferase
MGYTTQTALGYQHRSVGALVVLCRRGLALVLALLAMANIVTALVVKPWAGAAYVEQVIDIDSLGFERAEVVMLAALLLLVARALAHGKRQAWWLSICIVGLSVLGTLLSHARPHALQLAVIFLLVLVALSALFSRRSDPHALRRGYLALATSAGCLVLLKATHHLSHLGLVPLWHPYWQITLLALRAGLLIAVAYGVTAILLPVRPAQRLAQDERERAQELVRRHGVTLTAHFAAGEDKRFFWSDTGQAFVAYRLIRRVALVLGDPVGPGEEAESLLCAFVLHCHAQDWAPAWYLAGPRVRAWCRSRGMRAYKVGEEAEVDIARFTTAGAAGAPVRHAVTRARKGGVRVRCWQGEDLPAGVLSGMKRVSRAWQDAHDATIQMGFSMGRFPADWSRELLTAVACDDAGEVQAFLTWTPLYQGCGWSLDVMRRAGDAAPGTMELLIAESIEWAQQHGHRRMSLGLAPLAGLGAQPDGSIHCSEQETHSTLERIAGSLHQRKLFLANYTTLYRFKAKFQPTWEPRYLIVEDGRAIPQALSALMQAMGYTWKSVVREALSGMRPPPRGKDAR